MRQLGGLLEKNLKPVAKKRGFAQVEIISRWAEIVPAYAAYSTPVQVRKGTLTVAVSSSSAAHNMQMQGQPLMDRINRFFGYNAVQRLVFVDKGRLAPRKEPLQPNLLKATEAGTVWAKTRCAVVGNQELRESLERLGALIASDNKK